MKFIQPFTRGWPRQVRGMIGTRKLAPGTLSPSSAVRPFPCMLGDRVTPILQPKLLNQCDAILHQFIKLMYGFL